MGNIVETLQGLSVTAEDFVYLNYQDMATVWHIAENYIEGALKETDAPAMLARLLAAPAVTVYSRYEEDVLFGMRDNGLLDDYNRTGWFEDFLEEAIETHAYEYDLLTISTERTDHKRGTCEISVNVKVRAGDLYDLGPLADSLLAGFDVVVQTVNGTLTLN